MSPINIRAHTRKCGARYAPVGRSPLRSGPSRQSGRCCLRHLGPIRLEGPPLGGCHYTYCGVSVNPAALCDIRSTKHYGLEQKAFCSLGAASFPAGGCYPSAFAPDDEETQEMKSLMRACRGRPVSGRGTLRQVLRRGRKAGGPPPLLTRAALPAEGGHRPA